MSRGLDKVRADKEQAAAESSARTRDEFDKFSRESMLKLAETIAKSGMTGSREAAEALKQAAGCSASALMDRATSFVSGGGLGATNIGIEGRADISAGKALPGAGMLEAGSAKTEFGKGVDLGGRLDSSFVSGMGASGASGASGKEHERLMARDEQRSEPDDNRQTSLVDKSAPGSRAELAPRSLDRRV